MDMDTSFVESSEAAADSSPRATTASLTAQASALVLARLIDFAFAFVLPLFLVRRLSQHEFGLYKQVFLIVIWRSSRSPIATESRPRSSDSDWGRQTIRFSARGSTTCCQIVLLDGPAMETALGRANSAWTTAEEVRPRLLAAAVRQIGLSHLAYRWLYEDIIAKGALPVSGARARRSQSKCRRRLSRSLAPHLRSLRQAN
jgi:hypothetical protein